MVWLDAGLAAGFKKVLQSLVPERLNHTMKLYSVALRMSTPCVTNLGHHKYSSHAEREGETFIEEWFLLWRVLYWSSSALHEMLIFLQQWNDPRSVLHSEIMYDMRSRHFATSVSRPNSIDLLKFCGTDEAHIVRSGSATVDDVATLIEEDKVPSEVAAMVTPLPCSAKMTAIIYW